MKNVKRKETYLCMAGGHILTTIDLIQFSKG